MHALRDIADLIIAQLVKDPSAARLPRPLTGMEIRDLRKRQGRMNRLVATWSPRHTNLTPNVSS